MSPRAVGVLPPHRERDPMRGGVFIPALELEGVLAAGPNRVTGGQRHRERGWGGVCGRQPPGRPPAGTVTPGPRPPEQRQSARSRVGPTRGAVSGPSNTLGEHPGRLATAREGTRSNTPGPEALARPRRFVNLSSRRKVTWSPGRGPPGTDSRPGHPHRFCPLHPARGRSPGLSPTGVRVNSAHRGSDRPARTQRSAIRRL